MNIGERIKQRRTELDWSQRDLAKKMGYTNNSTIAKIEQGKVDVSQTKLEQFCKVLNVNMLYFFEDEFISQNDTKFIKFLGYIQQKEKMLPEIEAVNTFLHSKGLQIIKVNGEYYFDDAGKLTEKELNEFLNTITTMVYSISDSLIKKKTKQNIIDFFDKTK